MLVFLTSRSSTAKDFLKASECGSRASFNVSGTVVDAHGCVLFTVHCARDEEVYL